MTQRSLFPRDGLPKSLRTPFEAFWKAYPPRRPNPRALAEAEFAKAVRAGAEAADLVRAAQGYAAEVKRKGIAEDFVVHAATFLRQRRFTDYQAAPEAAPAAAAPHLDGDHPLWPHLRSVMSPAEFVRWVQPLEVLSFSEGAAALLVAPTRFHRDWVRTHFALTIKGALRVKRLDIDIMEDIQP
jgi:hypothetical protein